MSKITPMIGESFSQHRSSLLQSIELATRRARVLGEVNTSDANRELAEKISVKEMRVINDLWEEVRQLHLWFRQSGLDKDEPYKGGDRE